MSLTAVALVSIAPMMRSRAQSPPTSYTITDLGTLGGTESKAFAINSCGQIAGYATLAGGSKRPFFRPSSSLINLGVLSGEGTATSVNNSGYVVGNSPAAPSSPRAFIWHDDNGNNANDAGEIKQLLPNGAVGAAEDINENGRVVGWIESAPSEDGTGGFAGFTWENNNFQLISGSPAHNSTKVYGINNAGSVVGEDSDLRRGFILRNGVFTDIPVFAGGIRSVAYAVSEADHAVGTAALDSNVNPTMHAFIWTDAGGLKDLGTLTGKTRSTAFHVAIVSNSVQVVGASYSNIDLLDARAFVWQDANGDGDGNGVEDVGEMKYLWDLIPVAEQGNWTALQQARSINSSGQIVGFGLKTNGETHAFLLTPPSGPPSACLPTVNVSVSPASINEDAAGSMTYTFTRSIVTASPLTVSFSTTGTAVANDYAISSVSNVQIPENQASATVNVTPIGDTTDEPNETVILTVTPDAAYTIAAAPQNAATGTITDDDATPTISITNVTAAEPISGSTDFVFTVSLTNPSSSQIAVNYATAAGATNPATGGSGSCAPGNDFLNTAGTFTFLPGDTSKQLNVTVCSDSALEPDETFFVNLSGNSANSVLPANTKGTGTITPQAPVVYVEAGTENNPIPTAVAVDSATFARGPFKLTNNLNFSSDRLTRVILVTSNLGMTQADLATGILTVNVAGYATPLPIEHVGTITGVVGLNASFIIVRLPADLPNPLPGPNNLTLTVKMGSATSNATLLSIAP